MMEERVHHPHKTIFFPSRVLESGIVGLKMIRKRGMTF